MSSAWRKAHAAEIARIERALEFARAEYLAGRRSARSLAQFERAAARDLQALRQKERRS
jgi:hypothetical protein